MRNRNNVQGNLTLTQYTLTQKITMEKLEIFGIPHQGQTCIFWFNEIILHITHPALCRGSSYSY